MSDTPLFPTLAVILAAGQGSRMRSTLPKVLHQVGNRPLLGHVLASSLAADVDRLAVVIGPDQQAVADYVRQQAPEAQQFIQYERLGTAHAVLAAQPALQAHSEGCVLVLFGDSPLIGANTLARLRQALIGGAAVAVAGFVTSQPGPYGRLLTEGEWLLAIREAKDASPAELEVQLCNGGVMGLRAEHCLGLLQRIGKANAQGEYYLTDAVALANAAGLAVQVVEVAEEEVLGVNDPEQLQAAEQIFQRRLRQQIAHNSHSEASAVNA
ncbi:NTP transferase domain-containing protein [Pseudomonas sp.]|uniref:NTP transferase domain-containing protein n=1 Tax=Pseudomonas sp. TaxID=306 RepID=UPI00273447A1|nr:NTP transferase domain-containing protein [Pseudomonas sp.]MDP3813933.1 NTP transferase domain-containing protein [Pseudomonas sp.]